jgi:uncharacterized membrane protein
MEQKVRVPSIDILRGLVMILMALDHVRDYLTDANFDPTDLTRTTVPLFLTRWITHLCAPTFLLLAGMSAYLAGRKRNPTQLSQFLWSRGVWLIVLEFTLVSFAWYFNFRFEYGVLAQVIWAIGISMVVLAGLVHLPRPLVGTIAFALIAGHNLLDAFDSRFADSFWYAILHVRRPFPELHFMVQYPVLPLIGVMAAGFVLGPVLERTPTSRDRVLTTLGLGCIALFVTLRLWGGYGEPSAWSAQPTTVLTLLSFLNTTKYPASLLYLLMTLGPALVAIPLLDRLRGTTAARLATFGRAPLFFYVLHLYLIHAITVIAGVLSGFPSDALRVRFVSLPPAFGYSLPVVYLIWIGVVVALYWPTRWFGELKARRREWWWGYL